MDGHHEIQPEPESIRDRTGAATGGLGGSIFPLTGECMICGVPVLLRGALSDWVHTEGAARCQVAPI